MSRTRTIVTAIAAGTLSLGAVAVGAPSALAAPSDDTAACSVEHRAELRATIAGLREQIVTTRLTPEQHAERHSARLAAIAALRAQYRPDAGDPAAVASARAGLAQARADLAATTDPVVRDALRQQIAGLRATIEDSRGTTLTDAQRSELRAQIQALVAADKQASQARHSTIADLKGQIETARAELQGCRS